jgi:hypothetical protein
MVSKAHTYILLEQTEGLRNDFAVVPLRASIEYRGTCILYVINITTATMPLTISSLKFMICHSKSAIDPAPQDVTMTTRWNIIIALVELVGRMRMHNLIARGLSLQQLNAFNTLALSFLTFVRALQPSRYFLS